MRRTILVLSVLAVAAAAVAAVLAVGAAIGPGAAQARAFGLQFGRPRISPHESTSETVGGAKLTIVYGRPSMRGRTIYGSLIPYGVVWCPGADEATTLESTRPIRMGDFTIPRGPHTIWVIPTRDRWTLIVSEEESGFHTRYPYGSDLGRVEFTKRDLAQPIERLTFEIRPGPSNTGTIAMLWEKTEASVAFTVQ